MSKISFTKMVPLGHRSAWGSFIYTTTQRTTVFIRAEDVITIETDERHKFPYENHVSVLTPRGGEPFYVEGEPEQLIERVDIAIRKGGEG